MSDRLEVMMFERLRSHPDTPGRMWAASMLPSDGELCEDVGQALEGWYRDDLAADIGIDPDEVDWFEVADRLLTAGVMP